MKNNRSYIIKNVVKKNKQIYFIAKKSRNIYRAQSANIIKYYVNKTDLISKKKYDLQIEPTLISIKRDDNIKTAVVIHLFYTESWDLFVNRLKCLNNSFDIFITIPKQNTHFKETIKKTFPSAYIFIVPNRGRDVLPFMKIISTIYSRGYQNILKIHSKKSKHRTDGNEWLSDMVDKLLPKSQETTNKLIRILDDPLTGIIGPQKHYMSLLVNFRQNWHHSGNIIARVYTKKLSRQMKKDKKKYGFFAGTMFWARVDALKSIIAEEFDVNNFEKEHGQIDCTFAHALERVFCLVPELEGRRMYEVNKEGSIKQIEYATNNIPEWSDLYNK